MDPREARQALIAGFRKEKQQIFENEWNRFLKSPQLFAAFIIYTAMQGIFTLLSGWMIGEIAFAIGILHEGYPFWCNFVILAVQLLMSAPGILSCIGFFLLRKNGAYSPDRPLNILGCRLVRGANIGICIAGGLLLLLYPTVIIGLGEFLPESYILSTFWVFAAITLIFILSITLLRLILRKLEENISCRKADCDFLLLTALLLPPTGILTVLFLPVSLSAAVTLLPVIAGAEYLLILYLQFMKKTADLLEEIDCRARQHLQNPLDPYNPYN